MVIAKTKQSNLPNRKINDYDDTRAMGASQKIDPMQTEEADDSTLELKASQMFEMNFVHRMLASVNGKRKRDGENKVTSKAE